MQVVCCCTSFLLSQTETLKPYLAAFFWNIFQEKAWDGLSIWATNARVCRSAPAVGAALEPVPVLQALTRIATTARAAIVIGLRFICFSFLTALGGGSPRSDFARSAISSGAESIASSHLSGDAISSTFRRAGKLGVRGGSQSRPSNLAGRRSRKLARPSLASSVKAARPLPSASSDAEARGRRPSISCLATCTATGAFAAIRSRRSANRILELGGGHDLGEDRPRLRHPRIYGLVRSGSSAWRARVPRPAARRVVMPRPGSCRSPPRARPP